MGEPSTEELQSTVLRLCDVLEDLLLHGGFDKWEREDRREQIRQALREVERLGFFKDHKRSRFEQLKAANEEDMVRNAQRHTDEMFQDYADLTGEWPAGSEETRKRREERDKTWNLPWRRRSDGE